MGRQMNGWMNEHTVPLQTHTLHGTVSSTLMSQQYIFNKLSLNRNTRAKGNTQID